MDLHKLQQEVLQYLMDGYLQNGGTPIFSISEITEPAGVNSHEFGKLLVENGLVKNQQFRPDGFMCSISPAGINTIDPNYFDGHISTIISVLGTTCNDWIGIMEILSFEPKDFQIAFDVAKVAEATGYIEAQYQHNDIFLKLTLRGQQYYNDNKATFN